MRVDHVSFSKSGGAGLVAQNLVAKQVELGIRSQLHTLMDSSIREDPLAFPQLSIAAIADNYLVSSDPRGTMFSLFRSKFGLFDFESLNNDSIVHLHWVDGVVTPKNLAKLLDMGRRVVWTMHDMSPFTGGCHHSHGCLGYESTCSGCPQANSLFRSRVEASKSQSLLPRKLPNLAIVTPTVWMEDRARNSSRFANFAVTTIPNPISEVFLRDRPRDLAREELGITEGCVVFIAIAANLSDPAKQIQRLVASFASVPGLDPADKLLLLVGGAGQRYENLETRVRWLGPLSSSELAEVAAAADWVLSTSIAESAGMTIVECGALGVPSIALDSGGVKDMINNSVTGLLVESYEEFERCLGLAARKEISTQELGRGAKAFARNRHDPKSVAEKYLEIYEG